MAQGKGNNKKQDFIPANQNPKPDAQETEKISSVDKSKDFVKAGETA